MAPPSLGLSEYCEISSGLSGFEFIRQSRIIFMFSFVETALFSRLVCDYFSDEEYQQLQLELIQNSEAGVVIRGSGGVRKIRWRARSRGKRGGYRIIYFVQRSGNVFWMLTIYPKSTRDAIPGPLLKKIRQEIENGQQ